jgi:hypothetical protein
LEDIGRVVRRNLTVYVAHDEERGAEPPRILLVVHDLGNRDIGAGPHHLHAVPLQAQVEDGEGGVGRRVVRGQPGHVAIRADGEEDGFVGHSVVRQAALAEDGVGAELVGDPVRQVRRNIGQASSPRQGLRHGFRHRPILIPCCSMSACSAG